VGYRVNRGRGVGVFAPALVERRGRGGSKSPATAEDDGRRLRGVRLQAAWRGDLRRRQRHRAHAVYSRGGGGKHEIEFRKQGYYPASQSTSVGPNQRVVVELPVLARRRVDDGCEEAVGRAHAVALLAANAPAQAKLSKGDPAPPFELRAVSGASVSSQALAQAGLAILTFLSLDSKPSRELAINLAALAKPREKGMTVVAWRRIPPTS
jgi:hypothetical protein